MKDNLLVSRRFFIGGAFAFAARGPRVFAAEPGRFVSGRPALTFGVLSDVHVALLKGGRKLRASYGTEHLEKAFAFFRDEGVDAVVIAGDMAHDGCVGELKQVADAWFRVFPNDRAPDGRKVERLFVFGNHDNGTGRIRSVYGKDEAAIRANLLTLDPKRHWADVFHEDWQPIMRKTVRGYDFIGFNWTIGDCNGRCENFTSGMAGFYEKNGASLDPKIPFFHIQHPHPRGTVHGNVWGQDTGESVRALARFPNAVSFSGHSHTSLIDEKAVWQGSFTAFGTASLRNTGESGFLDDLGPAGFENGSTPKGDDYKALDALKVMPCINRHEGKQGQLVRVYGDRLVVSRRDFVRDLPLTDDLVLPLPAAESKPFAFETRKQAALAPRFAAASSLAFRLTEAKERGAKKGVAPKPCLEITVPPALDEKSAPGVAYEVRTKGAAGSDLRVTVVTEASRRARRDANVPSKCRISLERLGSGKRDFEVRARSTWGRYSEPLRGTFEIPVA